MKSAVFYGKHDLRVEESAKPAVGRRDVLINVKACGVCGTDVHIYEGDKGAADVTPPTILGHEFAGVVEAVGSDVTGFKPGDRVCIDPNHPCGCCEPCRDGINHYCEHMTGYGTTVNGGFAEYCSVDMQQVYKLGDHTSFEQGAMTEPVACCLHGIERACGEAYMEDKHLYRETQWDVSAEESRAHHGLVAIGFAVLAVLVIAFCIWTFGGRGGAAWEFEADDALPIMTVRSTGGNAREARRGPG